MSWSLSASGSPDDIVDLIDDADESPKQTTDEGRAQVKAAKAAARELVAAAIDDEGVAEVVNVSASGHAIVGHDAGAHTVSVSLSQAVNREPAT